MQSHQSDPSPIVMIVPQSLAAAATQCTAAGRGRLTVHWIGSQRSVNDGPQAIPADDSFVDHESGIAA